MTQIITFGNFKGGVGKTTNSTMVAFELNTRGLKTLLIDLDPQGNASNLFLKTKYNIEGTITSVQNSLMTAIEKEDLSSAIISIDTNLDLLASAPDFSLFPRYMERFEEYNSRVKYFSELLKPLQDKYDYIIIDIPPTISLITDSALYASDYCVIVMQTHEHSFIGANSFIEYIQNEVVNNYQAPRLEIVGILAVLLQAGAPVDEATVANAIEEFGEQNIFNNKIYSMQRLKRYSITGITKGTMHDKKVQTVYKKVTDELLNRIEVIEHGELTN